MTKMEEPASADVGHFAALHAHKLRFTVGANALAADRALTDADVNSAVGAFNAQQRNDALGDLQALNPQCVNPAEVLAFLRGLARQSAATLSSTAKAALDLAAPELHLHYQDGFGVHGLGKVWHLTTTTPPRIQPAHDLDDAVAEMATVTAAEKARHDELQVADKKLAATDKSGPDYGPVFRARFAATMRLAEVQRVRLQTTRTLRELLPASGSAHGHSRAQLDSDRARLERALEGVPLGGSLPGSGPTM